VRRSALLLTICLALFGAACGGGDDKPEVPDRAPQSEADAFVAELLDGRPSDAAERLSPVRSELEFQLPSLSIQLQTNGYRVADRQRQGKNKFIYTFRGAKGPPAKWEMTFQEDLGRWAIVTFGPLPATPTS
jgi:hypothetical protein